jgi:2-methylisocitrate lyase-like PEP mutase family enzyme
MGYRIAAYPLTLLNVAVRAMQEALADLRAGRSPERRLTFTELKRTVGFDAYDALARRYAPKET